MKTELKPNTQKLRQLAAHIVSDQRGHKIFDFAQYDNGEGNICGTVGCAWGELPVLWPNEYRFERDRIQRISDPEYKYVWEIGEEDFGLTPNEWYHLFLPGGQMEEKPYYTQHLGRDATVEQVAQNIIRFCAHHED